MTNYKASAMLHRSGIYGGGGGGGFEMATNLVGRDAAESLSFLDNDVVGASETGHFTVRYVLTSVVEGGYQKALTDLARAD